MISRNIRNIAGFFAWAFAEGILVLINFSLVVANYLACLVSFTLLGVDTKPLGEDELFGPLFMTIAPRATQAHLYAAVIAAAMAAGFFFIFRFLFHSLDLYRDRKGLLIRKETDTEKEVEDRVALAKAAALGIQEDLLKALVLSIAMGFLVYWDIQLFRYRFTAGLSQIESPDAAAPLLNWQLQWQQNNDLFGWVITKCGAWGYVAVTALGCLLLEGGFTKMRTYFDRFVGPIDQWLENRNQPMSQPSLFGYDETGEPVYDAETPAAYDAEGQPLEPSEAAGPAQRGNRAGSSPQATVPHSNSHNEATSTNSGEQRSVTVPENRSVPYGDAAGAPSTTTHPQVSVIPATMVVESDGQPPRAPQTAETGNSSPSDRPSNGALFDPQLSEAPLAGGESEDATRRPIPARGSREVIGDSGRRVSPQEALAHPDMFHVDPASGEIWVRNFWDAIHGRSTKETHEALEPANAANGGEN